MRIRRQQRRFDVGAYGLAAFERRLRLRAGRGLRFVVARMFGVEPVVNQLFLLGVDRGELLLEGTQPVARIMFGLEVPGGLR